MTGSSIRGGLKISPRKPSTSIFNEIVESTAAGATKKPEGQTLCRVSRQHPLTGQRYFYAHWERNPLYLQGFQNLSSKRDYKKSLSC
jgi:hypothetical protein